ncbi:twin-arginine translocation signal domain-containing protein [Streptomyces sp. NPDC004074]|uniref:twin-arginine translocation signal domain-containing protein n=1 Tax=unclassified Streptomyces TaxID=2593676 RepID=UPI0033B27E02
MCIERDADDPSGAGQSPSHIPVDDEFADGVLIDGSECLAGSESVEGHDELVQVLQYCNDLTEGHTDLSGGHIHQPIQLESWCSDQILIMLVRLRPPLIIGGRIRFACRRSLSRRCRGLGAVTGLTQSSDYNATTSTQQVGGDTAAGRPSPLPSEGRGPHAHPGQGPSMWSTTSRRRFVGAAAIGVALTATSGCTVPDDAVAGIAVTADGHLLGVMMVCGHQIDGATLYVDNDDVNKQVTVGSWTADHPLTQGLATWTLDSPAPGWTATKSLAPLTAKTTYTLYGWTRDNTWSASSVSFTLADRDRLTPGKVRHDSISDNGDESAITVSIGEFKAKACRNI